MPDAELAAGTVCGRAANGTVLTHRQSPLCGAAETEKLRGVRSDRSEGAQPTIRLWTSDAGSAHEIIEGRAAFDDAPPSSVLRPPLGRPRLRSQRPGVPSPSPSL